MTSGHVDGFQCSVHKFVLEPPYGWVLEEVGAVFDVVGLAVCLVVVEEGHLWAHADFLRRVVEEGDVAVVVEVEGEDSFRVVDRLDVVPWPRKLLDPVHMLPQRNSGNY